MKYLKEFSGENLWPKITEYINYTINLLRDGDPNHFLKSCFDSRFGSPEEIQGLLGSRQFGSLVLKAFQYISDLIVNVNTVIPTFKTDLSSVKSNTL